MALIRIKTGWLMLVLVLLVPSSEMAWSKPAEVDQPLNASEQRGQYLFRIAGCLECHTADKGEPLAGGRAFETPFGSFYSPNISPDSQFGIGSWQLKDFQRAVQDGVAPGGSHYYPVFPYPSYTQMTDADVADLWNYLQTLPAVAQPNRPHQLKFPFQFRSLMWGWKLLFFDAGRYQQQPLKTEQWNRGAYLVRALGHCGECHSPRNRLGVVDSDRELAGAVLGPDNDLIPNITPDPDTGIGQWQSADLQMLLEMGMLPDGDFVGGSMAKVIDNSTRFLTPEDQAAMIEFLQQLPPISHDPDVH